METGADPSGERLLFRLRALASPVRLRLLQALIVPTRAPEIRLSAGRGHAGLAAERFLGRSTIIGHLEVLEEAGLVRRVGDEYVVDQQGMVAFLQDLGDLARLRALIEVDVEQTRPAAGKPSAALAPLPRLVVTAGPEAGRAFPLAGEGPWRVGRAPGCEVALGHDPHVSRVHATLHRDADGFRAEVAPSAKNAATLDFARVEAGAVARLRPGSVVGVGATTLVLQA